MGDIATRWAREVGDWSVSAARQAIWTGADGAAIVDQLGRPVSSIFTPGDGLETGDELLTAVLISLFTDATADDDDVIVDGTEDPRGWWAGPIGSKLWLRARARGDEVTAALVRDDVRKALAWMIEDQVAASVDVETEWLRPTWLGVLVVIRRTDGTRRALQFSRLWDDV